MQAELVVLSHLRWTFVWQRPQHIISRLAADRRTWFVEEPLACDVDAPRLRTEDHGSVTRVWLEVPGSGHVGFDNAGAASYAGAVQQLLGPSEDRTVWLYTPMALDMAAALRPTKLVYDVMDDLASFKGAAAELRLRHRQALRQADVVFTGGRSLYHGVLAHRPHGTHLFASGVEPEHFAPAAALRPRSRPVPVAGYVGVIDERVDLDLLRGLAHALPDWQIEVVGPVVKIDRESLPKAPNLVYPGPQPYARLPQVMAGFDVALMPFALNEATRSISPTKTLEYFAAGLPVVSTRVPDVVADHGAHVELADTGAAFADAVRWARRRPRTGVEAVVRRNTWDSIAGRMVTLIDGGDAAAVAEMA
ncbi:MAG TPA: glycosyltransferase [Acidimicrobiales bacterium]|nr:glycosyltransferase [Acidimicrobiales bacterium]